MGDSIAGYLSRYPQPTGEPAPTTVPRNISGVVQDGLPDQQRTAYHQTDTRVLRPSRIPASDLPSSKPLDSVTRTRMESLLGADFSHVRVHADTERPPGLMPSRVPAYTIGHDVHFAARQYAPHTPDGSWILAHELAHVAQQTRSWDASTATSADAAEQEARAAADAVCANKAFPMQSRTGVRLACAPPKPTSPPPTSVPSSPASPRIIREWAAPDGFVIDIEVGPGVARLGLEQTLPSGTEVGVAGWHRAHSSGAGVGAESGRVIRYAPPEVNLGYQNAGIESFVRNFNRERAAGVRLFLRTVTTTHPNSLRLASITYRLSASRGAGRPSDLFEVTINIANSRNHPRVWVDEPVVREDWTAFLRPRPTQIPKAEGVKTSVTKKAPPSPAPASAKAQPAEAGAKPAEAKLPASQATPSGKPDTAPSLASPAETAHLSTPATPEVTSPKAKPPPVSSQSSTAIAPTNVEAGEMTWGERLGPGIENTAMVGAKLFTLFSVAGILYAVLSIRSLKDAFKVAGLTGVSWTAASVAKALTKSSVIAFVIPMLLFMESDQAPPSEMEQRWSNVTLFLLNSFTNEEIVKGGTIMRYQAYNLLYLTKPYVVVESKQPTEYGGQTFGGVYNPGQD